jgi:hypothetical protein
VFLEAIDKHETNAILMPASPALVSRLSPRGEACMANLDIVTVLSCLPPNLGLFSVGDVDKDRFEETFYIRLWANIPEGSAPEFVIEATQGPIGSVAVTFDRETQVLTFGISMDTELEISKRWPVLHALNERNGMNGLITVFCLAPETKDSKVLAIDCSTSLTLPDALLEDVARDLLVSLIHATLARLTYESWHWVDVLYDLVRPQ